MKTFDERDGRIEYRVDGELHRSNGPAIFWSTNSWNWYANGLWHRYYGITSSGGLWYIHGVFVK